MMNDTIPIRVLLVDDHRTTLWGLAALIDGEAPRLQVAGMAATAGEALRMARLTQPDVILLDLDLGGYSGFDLIPELHGACIARIVILTGNRQAGLRGEAAALGAWAFVRKDEPAEQLIDAVLGSHSGAVLNEADDADQWGICHSAEGANSTSEKERLVSSLRPGGRLGWNQATAVSNLRQSIPASPGHQYLRSRAVQLLTPRKGNIMKNSLQSIQRFIRDEEGGVAIEYGLLAVLIALVMAIGASALGTGLNNLFENIADCFGTGTGTCPVTMPAAPAAG